MVAVGSLGEVWADLPVDSGEEEFKCKFDHFFGAQWEQVMVGAEKLFNMHSHWDGYFSVRNIKAVSGLTLADLAKLHQGMTRFNIMAG